MKRLTSFACGLELLFSNSRGDCTSATSTRSAQSRKRIATRALQNFVTERQQDLRLRITVGAGSVATIWGCDE